jgi:glycosyltransferase involved in cell wall biosynthesis
MHMAKIEMPLVIIGNPTAYKQDIIETANKYRLSSQIIFLHNVPTSDLPAIYAQALVFLYPSLFEGFGIPILEALSVGVPVIASRGSCFEETGGKSALYIDPFNAEELGTAIKQVISDEQFRQKMIIDGKKYAENFTDEKIVQQLMDVYQSLF